MISRRTPRFRAYDPDPEAPGRGCDFPGCDAHAGYRAPKSRTTLNDYWWFCLDHVRAYNGAWDFYKGMTPGQIEAQIRADTHWQRPSWRVGTIGSTTRLEDAINDPLGILSDARRAAGARADQARRVEAPTGLREPLDTLGLHWPVSLDEVKSRYKDLAKRHHPDANNGDRSAEERLKVINHAYSTLRRHLAGEAPVGAR